MMDNLARIISHGFAIVVVILLGIGFIYRGELFPDLELPDFLVPESEKMADAGDHAGDHREKLQPGTAVTQGTTADEPVQSASSAPVTSPVETSATATDARVESPEAAAAGVTGEEIIASPAVQESAETEIVTGTVVETLQAPAGEIPPPLAEESESAAGASEGIGKAGSDVTTDTIPPPVPSEGTPAEPKVAAPDESPVPTTGMAVPESSPVTGAEMQPDASGAAQSTRGSTTEVKPYELLAAAREAFWMHNYDDAEKNYRTLTELEPQNPDGYGELGNMYFSQGRWEEAAAAYYEAGTRLISEGRLDSARELVSVIRGLNGQQADELDKLITSAASTGNQ
jgi:Tetratricopeptide repeat